MAETIGTIIVTAIASETVAATAVIGSVTVAQIAGTVVLTTAAVAARYATQEEAAVPAERGQITTRQPLPPRKRGYGKCKLAGPLAFSETVGGGRWQVIPLHEGKIDGFEEHWLSEFRTFFSGGDGNSGFALGPQYVAGSDSYVAIDTRTGTEDQTAFAQLIAAFPALWTSAHRLAGLACALTFTKQPDDRELFTSVFPGAQPPAYRTVARLSRVWDFRDPAQDKDDPSTWTWTRNNTLVALDFHRHKDGMGLARFDDILLTQAALEEDWIPSANICDEDIGGEPRYTCSGIYELPNANPADVLNEIMKGCDGQPYERSDGAIGWRVGKTVAPVVHLTDDDIEAYDGMVRGENVFLACNEVTATYTSPDHDYQQIEAQAWRDEADISARGQVLTQPIELPWVTSHSQARRLMKIAFHRFNAELRGTLIVNMAGLLARNQRFITVTCAELNIAAQTFEIVSFDPIVGDFVGARIGVVSFDQAAYDWDPETEAGTPQPVPPGVMGDDA